MGEKLDVLIAMWKGALARGEKDGGRYVVALDEEGKKASELFGPERSIPSTRAQWHDHPGFFQLRGEDREKFHVRLLPEPYAGDLQNAPVVILMKNPSFGDHCYWEHEQADYKAAMVANIEQGSFAGKVPLLYLRPEFCHTGGARYFGRWFRELARSLTEEQKGAVTIQETVAAIATTVCVVQMTGYTSAKPPPSCATLHSAKAARAWVRAEVWPEVKEGRRSLLVMRDWKTWLEGVEGMTGLSKLPALADLKGKDVMAVLKDETRVDLTPYQQYLHIETASPRTPSFKQGSPQRKILEDCVRRLLPARVAPP